MAKTKTTTPGGKSPASKRQAIREKRRQQQRRQRMMIMLAIAGVALVVAAILTGRSIIASLTPVGDIIQITPTTRPLADGKTLGEANAPVTVEVYEDFQCPACLNFEKQIAPQIIDNYVATGKARFIFKQFPFLDDQAPGNESDQAANASMCASEQKRFWDYHDILFANWNSENAGAFSDKRLVAFAETLELDMQAFNTCFENNTYEDEINADLTDGKNAGVTGTPTIVVNGQKLVSSNPRSVPSYEEIGRAIDNALGGSGN